MARMKEKLGEERRLRKEKTEEKFKVKAKNKDKEMDIMILDGEDQKKEVIVVEENEECEPTGRK